MVILGLGKRNNKMGNEMSPSPLLVVSPNTGHILTDGFEVSTTFW
jgi:hypothetical protein